MKAVLRLITSAVATTLMGTGLVAITANPAYACSTPQDQPVEWSFSSVKSEKRYPGIPVFKDGKGGKLSVTKNYSTTFKFSVVAGAEAEAGVVFAKAKASLNIGIEKSWTTSVTHNYEHKISKNRYGNVKYVNETRVVSWRKSVMDRRCKVTVTRGKVRFPTKSEGWRYWETKS